MFLKGSRDHPRRCGENENIPFKEHTSIGSPPQVRGKPSLVGEICDSCRITPAGAGKTLRRCRQSRQHRDHPRRCGENAVRRRVRGRAKGSPPQVRGKQRQEYPIFEKLRITPAGAGKTVTRAGDTTGETDHPRRCGENSVSTPPTSCS